MRGIRNLFAIFLGLGLLVAFLSTVVVVGYALKILAFIAAVILAIVVIIFLVWAAIKEFVFDAWKKPPE